MISRAANPQYEKDLHDFCSDDDERAGVAFERLIQVSRPMLTAYVQRRVSPPVFADDIVQDVAVRLWTKRRQFRPMGWGSWVCFIRRSAEWSVANVVRIGIEIPFESIDDLPPADVELIDSLVSGDLDREEIRRCADITLLGIDAGLDRRTLTRRLLAAKMFYLDGESWTEIARFASAARPHQPSVTRYDLDEWLSDRSTLLKLFFESLYLPASELTEILLDPPKPGEEMDQTSGGRNEPFSASERSLVKLRFQNALLVDQILRMDVCPLTKPELLRLFDRCAQRFPFALRMRTLLAKVGKLSEGLALGKPGLWQRLAFEYWVFDDLPQNDIASRTDPAAREIGGQVTAGQLNVWLSNGRLVRRVAEYLCSERT